MGKIEKLFFVDVEACFTPGRKPNPASDQLIEIAAAVCDILPNQMARITHTYHSLILPMHERIHPFMPTGIRSDHTKLIWPAPSTERARVAPKVPVGVEWDLPDYHKAGFASANWILAKPLNVAMDQFITFRLQHADAAWTGQNPTYDWDQLSYNAEACGHVWPEHPEVKVDYHTFDIASRMLPLILRNELPGVGLKHSRAWAGVPGEQSHRAMGDVQDAVAVWNALALYDHGLPPRYVDQRELEGEGWRDVTSPDNELLDSAFLPGSEDMG